MSVVLGMNFGDEGKGLTTSFLCSITKNPIVVRFNGGHQAGHTVVHRGGRHVFSSFGSGTLQGVPTYWSKYCTFYPIAFYKEYLCLKVLTHPLVYVHPLCPVTTPYDVIFNRKREAYCDHGSVGVGFGATINRHEHYYKLYVQDLFHENVLKAKLENIKRYYELGEIDLDDFLIACDKVKEIIRLSDNLNYLDYTPIFEGAQGILLDQDFGFFPNVTRSNTTTKNALEISPGIKEVYYVTRSYLTRHGNGFMPNESEVILKNNAGETNKYNLSQGQFRKAPLDIDLINYSLECDNHFSKGLTKNLVITCNDQLEFDLNLLKKINTKFENVYLSWGPSLEDIVKL